MNIRNRLSSLHIVLVVAIALQAQAQTLTINAAGAAASSQGAASPISTLGSAALPAMGGGAGLTEALSAPGLDNSAQPRLGQADGKALQDAMAPKGDAYATRSDGPNQFQRFVQEATGRMLPIYGREFFSAGATYGANSALPVPDDYRLGPGDEVLLRVAGPIDFASSLVIDRDGQVHLPKVGAVTLSGVLVRDLDRTLTTQLSKVFSNFKANATLGRLRGIQVYVVGQAQKPGTYQMSSLSTLVNALFASGGPGPNGSMRAIELKRAGKTITSIDLYDFISKGDKSQDLALMNGDVIVISPVGPRVAVTGAFDQSAIYELKPGENSIESILSLSGGLPALATSQKAVLERINRSANPPRSVQEIALDSIGLRQSLQDGDVLTLIDISPAFANAVTLQGTVAYPLRYSWFEGMRIRDLIPERDALITQDYYKRKNLLVQVDVAPQIRNQFQNQKQALNSGSKIDQQVRILFEQINWDYAVIQRMNPKTLTSELIPFNLGKAVIDKDPSHNLPLLAGDIVTVLSHDDLRVPQSRQSRLVRVEGEVAAPGIYQAQPGETLPQLLRRIGGLTPQAYLFGTEFQRESVRVRQQENIERLIRRIEAQGQSQISGSLASKSPELAQQAALAQEQQQRQLQDQIKRLRSLKSNGRIALEMASNATDLSALPPIALEDADAVIIPSFPGFVSAVGSLNNENVFIYKPGKTVADIIKSAGLMEEADVSNAFVLRADGSIVTKANQGGLFGSGFESLALMPGDTLVVPAQLDRETRYNAIVRGAKDWTQILSNFGIGAAALKSLGY